LNILERRASGIRVILLPAPVQGSDAAAIIARRVEQANQWGLGDVLILGRGGGSLEDLLPFSEESVVRAVAASSIPVVSAVGHEIDWALSDYAADLRAPTPSAAAELVRAHREDAREAVLRFENLLYGGVKNRVEKARLLIRPFGSENMEYRFRAILQPLLVRFDDAKEDLLRNLKDRIGEMRRRAELARTALESGSPFAIMERGYSVVYIPGTGGKAGKVIRRASELKAGDIVHIRPLEGRVQAEVRLSE
jgi:exodeoxyribonuclease VII large subunit